MSKHVHKALTKLACVWQNSIAADVLSMLDRAQAIYGRYISLKGGMGNLGSRGIRGIIESGGSWNSGNHGIRKSRIVESRKSGFLFTEHN